MEKSFVRVCALTPPMRVADVTFNGNAVIDLLSKCAKQGVQVAVFPELCLSGYTCGDLFFQPTLLEECKNKLSEIVNATANNFVFAFVGLPYYFQGKIYNVAAAIHHGELLGLVPKTFLPNYNEFYEARQFTPSDGNIYSTNFFGKQVPFGQGLLFQDENSALVLGCEICEDGWVACPPSSTLALQGANVIANLSASNEVIGKSDYRKTIFSAQSGRCICGYVYASCGQDESTTDTVYSGHNLIYENGSLLAEKMPFSKATMLLAEIDVDKLNFERTKQTTFMPLPPKQVVYFQGNRAEGELCRNFSPTPFVPNDQNELEQRSKLILEMQANGLAKRLLHTHAKTAVVGVSGGLDSTLALLVTVKAFDLIGKDCSEVIAVTMPGFGTTNRTYQNAVSLIKELGVTLREISISKSVLQHFEDIGQDKNVYDVTYENGQARMRTLILMDIANQQGGLVIGTGDLSELALGWCTYNGDHMSMYAVNCSVPKTLVKYLVNAVAKESGGEIAKVLQDILSTEISPELLPPDSQGNISQKTEDLVGPYELHDFYLYYTIRWGFPPEKIFALAKKTFADKYDAATLKKWLVNFYRRFFSQQFKRSCIPDGVKIGSVTLSPRADWRMPSDASSQIWLTKAENLKV